MNKREVIEQLGKMKNLYASDDREDFYQQVVEAMEDWLDVQPDGSLAQEWQPIETAPKNIEIFIGSFIDEVFVFGKSVCFYEVGNEFEGEFYRGWFWSIDDVCESVAECPTHWMPLPKPPAMAQGEQ